MNTKPAVYISSILQPSRTIAYHHWYTAFVRNLDHIYKFSYGLYETMSMPPVHLDVTEKLISVDEYQNILPLISPIARLLGVKIMWWTGIHNPFHTSAYYKVIGNIERVKAFSYVIYFLNSECKKLYGDKFKSAPILTKEFGYNVKLFIIRKVEWVLASMEAINTHEVEGISKLEEHIMAYNKPFTKRYLFSKRKYSHSISKNFKHKMMML